MTIRIFPAERRPISLEGIGGNVFAFAAHSMELAEEHPTTQVVGLFAVANLEAITQT
tara:strand:- start:139 stop:309 length:171 start_codon:yes stop_codon:yes gene_type:complete